MDFSASNTALWNGMIQFGILSAIMLVANVLRRKVGFIRKSLMPTAVMAGFITLLLRIFGVISLEAIFLDSITYHTIAIGFIALSLRIPEKNHTSQATSLDGRKSGALIVDTYLMQGILGIIITAGLAYTITPVCSRPGYCCPWAMDRGPGRPTM